MSDVCQPAVTFDAMATTYELKVSVTRRDAARALCVLQAAAQTVRALEKELSEFDPQSPVHRFNLHGVAEGAGAATLLKLSTQIWERTQGAFSPLAKSREPGLDPRRSIEVSGNRMRRLDPRAHLSFGAIGKGFALDQVRTRLEQEGFSDLCLTAGGSSIVLGGFAGPRRPWRVEWAPWGRGPRVPLLHRSGLRVALGISGLQVQALHLIDPRSGEVLDAKRGRSALVAHPSAAWADALSTALFVAGFETASTADWDEFLAPGYGDLQASGDWRANGSLTSLFALNPERPRKPERWAGKALMATAFAAQAQAQSTEAPADSPTDSEVDLSQMGAEARPNPYVFERQPLWIGLPLLALAVVALHLLRRRTGGSAKSSAPPRGQPKVK